MTTSSDNKCPEMPRSAGMGAAKSPPLSKAGFELSDIS
jgi:hypothetical protein